MMNSWQTSITLVVATILLAIFWLKHRYSFWKNKGVTTPPLNYFWGNLRDVILQKLSFAETVPYFYNYFKSRGLKHGGIYSFFWPIYIPVDIDVVKSILQNDFEHFSDRDIYINEIDDPLSAHLFSLKGRKWKLLRAKLTPAFTSGKLKMMFETLVDCTVGLDEVLDDSEGKPLDIKDILARYTTDVIGNCAFGIECNSLKEPTNDFRVQGFAFFNRTLMENIKIYLGENNPDMMRMFKVCVNRPEVSEFFMGLVRDTISFREKNGVFRKDFMHLLIQLKNRGQLVDDGKVVDEEVSSSDNTITFEEICAQAFVFFIAAFETSSTAMSFSLYLLAIHEEIQCRVRGEIMEVLAKYGEKITYEGLSEMVFLDKVVYEAMRLFPPLPFLNRICTKDYRVPGCDLLLKKGQRVLIPVMGIQNDAEFYAEPEKFDPERFSEENKKLRNPFAYLPFGHGPRVCIGMRFGMMQTKVGIVALLRKHKFSVNAKTKTPLSYDPRHPLLSVKGGIWLDFKKIEN